jgi:D-xylose transport system permease protein
MNIDWQTLKRAQIDWRMVLMSTVLVVIAVVFNVLSEGIFLSPENLYNIAQQTAVVGILATVMVLIIVARHIDLSVGSVTALAMVIAGLLFLGGVDPAPGVGGGYGQGDHDADLGGE